MKISIMLPTRDRRDLLCHAINSVLVQDYVNWEILVSDNASKEDVSELVQSFGDARIRYSRSEQSLAVTDNWNRVLGMSTGDYLIMLGDDDFLLPGALRLLAEAVTKWNAPDFFYVGALEFAYPGVVPHQPSGFVSDYNYSEFIRGRRSASLLPLRTARRMAYAALNFKLRYGFNMQFFVFRRGFVESLSSLGPFFQSPFPDYYAANVAMLLAQRIVVLPDRIVAIGISPKSYGFYHLNNQEKEGMKFLASDMTADPVLQSVLLPGSNINSSWAISVTQVKNNLAGKMNLKIDYGRYRRLQLLSYLFPGGQGGVGGLKSLTSMLVWQEKLFVAMVKPAFHVVGLLPGRAGRAAFALLGLATRQYIFYWRKPVQGFATPEALISAWQVAGHRPSVVLRAKESP